MKTIPNEFKNHGKEAAEASHKWQVELCRDIARDHAMAGDGTCSINDVRARLKARGYEFPMGNWTGSIFKGRQWHYVTHIRCAHKDGNGRRVALWKYAGDVQSQPGIKIGIGGSPSPAGDGVPAQADKYQRQPSLFGDAA